MTKSVLLALLVIVVAGIGAVVLAPVHGAVVLVMAAVSWIVHRVAIRRMEDMAWLGRAALSVVAALLLVQLIPYGRSHDNPPVVEEPAWDSAATRELAVAACFDCHSNETEWPWYTNVAPGSWITARHVEEGREKLNFSEWNRRQEEADDAAETVRDGEMPLRDYLLVHPAARLTDAQKQALVNGLVASLGGEGGEGGDDDD